VKSRWEATQPDAVGRIVISSLASICREHGCECPVGWWVPSNYQTVTASESFVLAPTETNTSNLHAIRVQRGVGNNFWLWLEYRQNSGYDSTFSAFNGQIYSGAMIHFEDPTNTTYVGYTRLLNYTAPANPDFSEPALAVGSTWSDPYSLLTLSVPSADASGLHLTVNYDPPCAKSHPAQQELYFLGRGSQRYGHRYRGWNLRLDVDQQRQLDQRHGGRARQRVGHSHLFFDGQQHAVHADRDNHHPAPVVHYHAGQQQSAADAGIGFSLGKFVCGGRVEDVYDDLLRCGRRRQSGQRARVVQLDGQPGSGLQHQLG
jgi:hypothetical protein